MHYLFQQLASPPLIAATQLGAASDDDANLRHQQSLAVLDVPACHRPALTTWIVEKAVTDFLQSILSTGKSSSSNSSAQHNHNHKQPPRHWKTIQHHATAIQLDLIQTLTDLAILAQYVATTTTSSRGTHTTTTTTNDNPDNGDKEDDDGIQILLFPKTSTSLRMEQTSMDQQHSNNLPPEEYALDVPCQDDDTIFLLQSSTLNILMRWRSTLEKARLKAVPIPEAASLTSPSASAPLPNHHPTQPKTMVPPEESIRDLLASLRPMFVSPSVSMLAERARSAALELLLHSGLVLPPGVGSCTSATTTDPGMDVNLLVETALLIVHAVGGVLLRQQQWRSYAYSTLPSVPTQAEDVLHNLMVLLRRTILFPPHAQGYTSDQVTGIVRQAVLMPLLEECLPWIQAQDCSNSNSTTTTLHNRSKLRQLKEMTLRTIHACLLTKTLPENVLATHPDPVSIVGPLLDLLNDAQLSPCSLSILTVLLAPLKLNIQSLCSWCWSHQNQTSRTRQFWTANIPPPPPPYPLDLPKPAAVQGGEAQQSPTKPSTSGQAKSAVGSANKTKRRPSLLGNNPLTIRSPTAKRPRHQEASAFSLNAESAVVSGTCFVEDLLQVFMVQGLYAAQNVSDYASSDEMGTMQEPREILEDASMLSGCTRLLFCMLQRQDSTNEPTSSFLRHGSEDDIIRGSSFLMKLAENWRALSMTIHKRASLAAESSGEADSVWTPEWEFLAEIAINCGLHYVQQVGRPYILESKATDVIFRQGWSNCCSALGLVVKVFNQAPPIHNDTCRDKACRGTCKEILGAFAIDAWSDRSFGTDVCLCEFVPTSNHHHSTTKLNSIERTFSNDCAIMMFTTLPLSTRYVDEQEIAFDFILQ